MSTAPGPIIFIRHGETGWNRNNRFQGTTDTALSQKGVTQARSNADLIKELISHDHFPAPFRHISDWNIVASPLKRARQTAIIIGKSFNSGVSAPDNGVPTVTENAAFRELSMGRWEGLTSQQVKDQFYEERRNRKLDRWRFAPQGGESLEQRVDTVEMAVGLLAPGTVLITHSGVLRIILHTLGGIAKEEAAKMQFPHHGLLLWHCAKMHTVHTAADLPLIGVGNCAAANNCARVNHANPAEIGPDTD